MTDLLSLDVSPIENIKRLKNILSQHDIEVLVTTINSAIAKAQAQSVNAFTDEKGIAMLASLINLGVKEDITKQGVSEVQVETVVSAIVAILETTSAKISQETNEVILAELFPV